KESVREILKYTEGQETAFEAFIEGKPYAQKEYVEDPVRFGATQRAIPYIQSTREPIEDMMKFIYDHQEILDCLDIVVKSEEKKRKLWKTLQENVKDVYITSSVTQLLEISHRDSGKEAGIRFLLEYLGLKREGLAAFGDGDNDREMISYARVGVAMGNASPACKKAADWIAPSNEEDGVAWGIEKLLEENRSGL
ncbi:MAG TPA: HAD-IIB family hydrolase, partial [Candidatus Blautia avicola]|nr:HAD-IIB family hydrolase [Candidatus Blautia avicola]